MIREKVEVHEVISQELYKVADKSSTVARLAFPHLICHLCYSVGIDIEGDTLIVEDEPINKKGWSKQETPLIINSLRCLKGCTFLHKTIGSN